MGLTGIEFTSTQDLEEAGLCVDSLSHHHRPGTEPVASLITVTPRGRSRRIPAYREVDCSPLYSISRWRTKERCVRFDAREMPAKVFKRKDRPELQVRLYGDWQLLPKKRSVVKN